MCLAASCTSLWVVADNITIIGYETGLNKFFRFGYTLNVEFKKETLKNGVRLLTLPMSHLDSVAVIIGVSAGSRFEEPRTQGVAHFTEHMLFKGTKRRPNNRVIATELESMGADFNAFTGQD